MMMRNLRSARFGKMRSTIVSEVVAISSQESSSSSTMNNGSSRTQIEIESVKCECCCLTEECTPAYIDRIREQYTGKWICSLCSEAVKDEIVRAERLISTEEAIARHLNVCRKFRASWPPSTNPTIHLITTVRQILRRSLESPRGIRSTPASPMRGVEGNEEMMNVPTLTRSESCFPDLAS